MRQVEQQPGIDVERDGDPVAADRRQVAGGGKARLAFRPQPEVFAKQAAHVLARPDQQVAVVAVDDQKIAGLDAAQHLRDAAQHRDVEGAGDDRHMGGRRALLQHQAAQPATVVVEQLGRAHVARHQHEVVGQLAGGGREHGAAEMLDQPVGEIVEIMQPLAQIGIGDLVSSWTFWIAASAVSPPRIASAMRPSQPRSAANMR
jgi:hypothetical protein